MSNPYAHVSLDGTPGTIEVVHETEEITVLDLAGEFDIDVSPDVKLHAERIFADAKHLIIDLSETTFIDSSLIHTLFTADETAKATGCCYIVQIGDNPQIHRLLTITGANRQLATAATRPEALNLINNGGLQRHQGVRRPLRQL
jgi:anti-anti-sigma factor